MTSKLLPRTRFRQRGAALLLMLLVAITLGLAFFFRPAEMGGTNAARSQQTMDALAQAKAALIGYAATYRDTHPNTAFGYLPCPDINNDGVEDGGCGPAGETRIGRLPYKTLGLPDLRGADGECLWYIVSGSHKNNTKTVPLNWDTRGNIRIQDSNGTALADPGDALGGAMAVIIAPGAPLAGQSRPSGAQPCSGDASNSIAAYLDGGYAAATSGTLTVVSGGSATNNDQLAWTTPKEVFSVVSRRNDLLGSLMSDLKTCLNFTDTNHIPGGGTAAAVGSKWVAAAAGIDRAIGPMQLNCTFGSTFAESWAQWRDHFRYLVCTSPTTECLQVNGVNCSGALIFGGSRADGRPRTAAERADAASYFEGVNLAALTTPATTLTAALAYAGSTPAQDVAICLNPAPPKLSFADNFSDLSTVAYDFSGKSLATLTPSSKTLTLGVVGMTGSSLGVVPESLFGCSWFGTTLPFQKGLRAYFRYKITNVGQGFTFAIADADPARNPSASMCGKGGSSLGYSGTPTDTAGAPSLTIAPINYPKIALEIDTSQNSAWNDPNNSHMAMVYWGDPSLDDDNIHDSPAIPVAGSLRNPLAVSRSIVRDTGINRYVRIEIVRGAVTGGHTYAFKAWVLNYLPADFDNLTSAFDEAIEAPQIKASNTPTVTINDLVVGTEALRNIRIGFTGAGGSFSDQQILINDFQIKTIP